jgi:hypothetical protein
MYRDDMTEDVGKWLPAEGWYNLEIASMVEGTSKNGNPKFTVSFVSASDPGNGIIQDMTNIPGKRWLQRQLLEACGIVPEENEEGRKIYAWDIPDVEGHTVSANIAHDKTPFIDRDGNERIVPKAKIIGFKKVTVQ